MSKKLFTKKQVKEHLRTLNLIIDAIKKTPNTSFNPVDLRKILIQNRDIIYQLNRKNRDYS